jgi:hypothetical protein
MESPPASSSSLWCLDRCLSALDSGQVVVSHGFFRRTYLKVSDLNHNEITEDGNAGSQRLEGV